MIPDVPGADAFAAWFGHWPSFHDAEILELHLSRDSASWLKMHTWLMTGQVGADGYYVLDKHAVVTFHMEEVTDLELAGFSGQNVIFGVEVTRTENGYRLALDPCFGLFGYLEAERMSIALSPGQPEAV